MDLIERLRPRWRHSDPEVRAAAVREMGAEDRERLGTIAREDPDPVVRRAAIKRLEDPESLGRVAAHDSDPALRTLAAERAREVLVAAAAADGPRADCETALAGLGDERDLALVASTAAHDAVRRAALARVTGDRVLRDVVRNAADPAVRREALGRIVDSDALRSVAVADVPQDLAVDAVARIDDLETLRGLADNPAAPKAVRQRARERLPGAGEGPHLGAKEAHARQLELSTLVHTLRAEPDVRRAAAQVREAEREWNDLARHAVPRDDVAERFTAASTEILADADLLARREAELASVTESLAARRGLCELVEALDGAEAAHDLAAARAAWGRLTPVPDDEGAELSRRFATACRACETRFARWRAGDAERSALERLVEEAEGLAAASPVPAPRRWRAVALRFAAAEPSGIAPDEALALHSRFANAEERFHARRRETVQERSARQQENLKRLEALSAKLGELAASESLKPGTARRQLDAAAAAIRDPGPLPPSEQRTAWIERLTEARGHLMRRAREMEETEEWRRWANVSAQEELIRRVEAVLASGDLAEGTRLLGRLQEDWKKVGTATRDKSQALWDRFRGVRNELRKRCGAYLGENLEKKRALCEQVAGVGDSTDWNATTELVRRLQAEWKAIGPVPARHSRELWQQFRAPCDRFFERRKVHFGRIDAERSENAKQKAALCERAEQLADSTDWDETAAALKKLQAEWKRGGPPPRRESDALWKRFRAACDRFFDRSRRRDEVEREALLEEARAICERLETLAAAVGGDDGGVPETMAQEIDQAWSAWVRLGVDAEDLGERLRAACDRIASAHPEALRGTRLDPDATRTRREKLCVRVEELVASVSAAPKAQSLQEMALALRERLATNTIAGSSGSSGRPDALRELERLSASWARLGPAVGAEARALASRFEQACTRVRAAAK